MAQLSMHDDESEEASDGGAMNGNKLSKSQMKRQRKKIRDKAYAASNNGPQ